VWLRDCGRWPPDRLPIWATLRPHEPAGMRPSGADRRAGHRRLNRARTCLGASVNARQRGRFRASMNTRAGTRDARPPSCLLAWLPLLARSPASPYALALRPRGRLPPASRNPARSMAATALNGASHAQRRRRHGATSRTGRIAAERRIRRHRRGPGTIITSSPTCNGAASTGMSIGSSRTPYVLRVILQLRRLRPPR
jgi:hypothetical protein